MWMTLKEYALRESISYTAARNAFIKYGSELMEGGHVKEEKRTTMIDEYGANYLASKRKWGKGSSLIQNVKYESAVKKAVQNISSTDMAMESVNRSKRIGADYEGIDDVIREIDYLQESIHRIRKEITDDYDRIIKISSTIRRNNRQLENLESKRSKLYKKIVDRQKTQDEEALLELIRQLGKEDSQRFKSIQFPKAEGKE